MEGKTDLLTGDFFGYYNDYELDKDVSLLIIMPQKNKATTIYKYTLLGKSKDE